MLEIISFLWTVKILVKFSLFHRMDIWEAHSNSYGFLQPCGNHIS